jgi:nucleoid-associated protein YgaU
LDDDDGTTDGEATLRLLPAVDDAAAAAPAPALEQWVVQRGDHLWSIAESHLSEVLGRAPTDAEITPYWRLVVEHNRPRLSNPSEPDLIFVGEVYELPPVPQLGA